MVFCTVVLGEEKWRKKHSTECSLCRRFVACIAWDFCLLKFIIAHAFHLTFSLFIFIFYHLSLYLSFLEWSWGFFEIRHPKTTARRKDMVEDKIRENYLYLQYSEAFKLHTYLCALYNHNNNKNMNLILCCSIFCVPLRHKTEQWCCNYTCELQYE